MPALQSGFEAGEDAQIFKKPGGPQEGVLVFVLSFDSRQVAEIYVERLAFRVRPTNELA
jgi:hypothetical protein